MTEFDLDPENCAITTSRPLRNSGTSIVLSIPPNHLKALDWESGDELDIEANWENEEITLTMARGTDR